MNKSGPKQRQMEAILSRLGMKVALATEELAQAEAEMRGASQRLIQVQREIEQLYIILDEPLILEGGTDGERPGKAGKARREAIKPLAAGSGILSGDDTENGKRRKSR